MLESQKNITCINTSFSIKKKYYTTTSITKRIGSYKEAPKAVLALTNAGCP